MKNGIYRHSFAKQGTLTRKLKPIVGGLLLFLGAVASFAPLTGAQKSNSSNRPSSKTMAEVRAKRPPSPRELLFSEDREGDLKRLRATTKRSREAQRGIELSKNVRAQSDSNQQQFASTSASTTSNVRLTFRDMGPETGFSGSGSGFTFNRDTRQVILPSPQRIFRSVNDGSQWAPLDFVDKALVGGGDAARASTEGSYFVRQDPRNPQILYAVGSYSGQLARSNDFGTTWTQLRIRFQRQFCGYRSS